MVNIKGILGKSTSIGTEKGRGFRAIEKKQTVVAERKEKPQDRHVNFEKSKKSKIPKNS